MKVLLLAILTLLVAVDPATVKKINAAKEAAEEAFKKGDYTTAIRHYHILVDSLGVNEDEVLLNLANAYYLVKDTTHAFNNYQAVTLSDKSDIRSKAHQQLGIMANKQGKAAEALSHFKQAIRAEPTNDDARYNYEMLKKKLEAEKKQQEEQQQKNKDDKKQDQENQDQQNKEDQQNKDQEQKDQEQKDQQEKDEQNKDQEQKDKEQQQQEKEKEQQEQEQQEKEKQEGQEQKDPGEDKMPNLDRDKLDQMKITEEKARMILEAMKNQEKQYLQEQKRKPSQSRDRNKPDW